MSPTEKIFRITPKNYLQAVKLAVEHLQRGDVIAVPTDTIYGIAGLVTFDSTVQRIYDIKRRDMSKPLAICVSEIPDMFRYVIGLWHRGAKKLIRITIE
jgi:tRNA A37 threonylcarbamoyladenosine synthetase subunit TsaC/SUA5/YrdC